MFKKQNMDVPQRFCVRWNSYKSNLQTAFPKLLTSEHFVDVTLACEKQFIKCHKIVLSACSAYFETLLVNNPCQHPIIFMKDVQFWEIKALVEFMYKGEVNVSQNQLDSLLKSAESLQIRGLSGTKQFINFEQSDEIIDDNVEVRDECKMKKSKCDNEEMEEECVKKRRKRNDDDEKCIQITSVKEDDEAVMDRKSENGNREISPPPQKPIKEEASEQEDFDFENSYSVTGEETESFSHDVFYPGHNSDPGPSGMSDGIYLEE
ncbi:UNVERIFIED_CONTAM: hypothetical protein PYX00_002238 [Menopon gallinae]|uniref:BTB domain-containing protein n=1 Tax=Menopon gallinae TaxID=328185 RepID=A0AAW2IFW4_9NEOP